jgi:hypothetical protein
VESTASTHSQQAHSGPRPTARAVLLLAVTACCAALLSAVTADRAAASAVIITPGYVSTLNASDSMDGAATGGFGTADVGGSWATALASKFSLANGTGHISAIAPGQTVSATLSDVHPADERTQSTFTLPKLPTAGLGIYYNLEFRKQTTTSNAYRVQLRVGPAGDMTLGFSHLRNNVASPLGTQVRIAQRAAAGRTIVLQGLVAGSSSVLLRARAWLSGTTIPGWQLGATDSSSTRLYAIGKVGVYGFNHPTSASTAVTIDGFMGWRLAAAAPVAPPGGKPGSSNTGVPVGTQLTQHNGNITVTVAGTHLNAMDLHGFLIIQAANVLVTNSILRGGVATSGNPGLVSDTSAAGTNFVIQDSTIVPEHPSVALDGVRGGNFTLTRVDLYGTVDGAKVIGSNVSIQNSWIHGTVSYPHDPYQGNGPSHNDAVQVLSGSNIHISGNTIAGGSNSGMQVTQGNGTVSGLSFTNNWADGGGCTLNVADAPMTSMAGVNISNNIFGHTSTYANCAIIVSAGVSLAASGNTWAGTTNPVAITPRA